MTLRFGRSILVWAVLAMSSWARADDPITLSFEPSVLLEVQQRQALQPATAQLPKLESAVELDGRVDEGEWRQAQRLAPAAIEGSKVEFFAAHDGRRLLLAARCEVPANNPIRASSAPYNQGTIWRDDCMEVWLLVQRDGQPQQYQFVVNAAGARLALAPGDDPLANATTVKASTWQAFARQDDNRFQVEIALSPEAVGLTAWPAQLSLGLGRGGPTGNSIVWNQPYGPQGAVPVTLAGVLQGDADAQEPHDEVPIHSEHSAIAILGKSLRVRVDQLALRPGQRWLKGECQLWPTGALEQATLRVELMGPDAAPVAVAQATPTRRNSQFSVDLRAVNLSEGQLVISVLENGQVTGQARMPVWVEPMAEPIPPGHRVRLILDVDPQIKSVSASPVRFGVPFPPGALWNAADVRLIDSMGNPVPAQAEVAAWWAPGGSIRWLMFDALVSSGNEYMVEFAPAAAEAGGLSLKQEGQQVTIDTGAAVYVLGCGQSPVQEVRVAGKPLASSRNARGLYVIDQTGRQAVAAVDGQTMTVESAGPLSACVRFEGEYRTESGEALARHITRVETFARQAQARVTHTLILIHDTNQTWFKEVGWELSVNGTRPQALFNTSRQNPAQVSRVALDGGSSSSAYMIQDSHYRFVKGSNHFGVRAVDGSGAARDIADGEECGDWAAWSGSEGGLMLACREAARQHPKEWEITGKHIVLRLFSPRGGEELDFRTPTLIKKWNLPDLIKDHSYIGYRYLDQTFESALADAAKLSSNAVGWAKTHQLMIAPLPAQGPAEAAARYSGPLTFPVYLHVSPQWIYDSGVFGPLHPRDPQRFAQAEAVLDAVVRFYDRRDSRTGLFGIMDYGSGPIPFPSGQHVEIGECLRFRGNYYYRRDVLLLAARSADRQTRDIAERVSRSMADLAFAHWEGPNRKRGGWNLPHGNDGLIAAHPSLPYWWEGITSFEPAASSQPEDLMYLYYLTGDRRAREVVLEYFELLRKDWTPAKCRQQFFFLRYLAQFFLAYEFTMDSRFADIARASLDIAYDADAALGLNQWVYAESYKVMQDTPFLIRASSLMTDPRLQKLATLRGKFQFNANLGWLERYQGAQGITYSYLYRQQPDAAIAEELSTLSRRIGAFLGDDGKLIDYYNIAFAAARVGALINGTIYGQDVLVRSNADRRPQASWVAARFDSVARFDLDPADLVVGSVYLRKPLREAVTIRCSGADASKGEVQVEMLDEPPVYGQRMSRVEALMGAYDARVSLAKHAPPGVYRISGCKELYALADQRLPMVLHAPNVWGILEREKPAVPVYFNVPADAQNPQIEFIAGSARLTMPDGQPFQGGKPVTGVIQLNAKTPGLWSFSTEDRIYIRVRNIPPFFAFRDPESYFEPVLPKPKP